MKSVLIDVSADTNFIGQIAAAFSEHHCQILGSADCFNRHCVRLVVGGEAIPDHLDGKLCRCTVTQSRDGLSYTRTLEFEEVKA